MKIRKTKLLLCYLVLLIEAPLLIQCSISPKYRSLPHPRATIPDVPENLIDAKSIYTVVGTASWYGPKFHGKRTANGEIFDMNKISAAHKEFPMGTWLRVNNLKNNRSITVRVNDRGPFIDNRIIDLSKKAAEKLGFVRDGLAEVKIEVLRWGNNKNNKL